ncbi:MAG: hypothetical protein PVI00_11530 [Desulfobacterales bacterium]
MLKISIISIALWQRYKNTNFSGQVKAFSAEAGNYLTVAFKNLTLNKDIIAQHDQKESLHPDLKAGAIRKLPYNHL